MTGGEVRSVRKTKTIISLLQLFMPDLNRDLSESLTRASRGSRGDYQLHCIALSESIWYDRNNHS